MGSLYGYDIDSDLPLERLNTAPGRRGLVTIEHTSRDLAGLAGTLTGYVETPTGLFAWAAAETADGCLLSFPESSAIHVAPDELRITVAPRGPMEEVEHRLVTTALCMLLAGRGDLALHASAVGMRDGAVLFCGPSERGKSTLAHALGRLGAPVLCEDGAIVELSASGLTLYPGPRGVRLRREVNGAVKVSLFPDPAEEPDPCPVQAIALLEERGAELTIEPLDAVEALLLLTPNLGHTGGRVSLARSFGNLGLLLRSVPAFRVSLPDGLDALPGAARRLLDTQLGTA